MLATIEGVENDVIAIFSDEDDDEEDEEEDEIDPRGGGLGPEPSSATATMVAATVTAAVAGAASSVTNLQVLRLLNYSRFVSNKNYFYLQKICKLRPVSKEMYCVAKSGRYAIYSRQGVDLILGSIISFAREFLYPSDAKLTQVEFCYTHANPN